MRKVVVTTVLNAGTTGVSPSYEEAAPGIQPETATVALGRGGRFAFGGLAGQRGFAASCLLADCGCRSG